MEVSMEVPKEFLITKEIGSSEGNSDGSYQGDSKGNSDRYVEKCCIANPDGKSEGNSKVNHLKLLKVIPKQIPMKLQWQC